MNLFPNTESMRSQGGINMASIRRMAIALREARKRIGILEEAFVIAVRHVGYHHSHDDLYGVLNRLGWGDLLQLSDDYSAWGEEE